MDFRAKNAEIANESAFAKKYIDQLVDRARGLQRSLVDIARNTWTTTIKNPLPVSGRLYGRIALDNADDPELEGSRNFYIGDVSFTRGERQVFSWLAPVAACCFYGRPGEPHHEWCSKVAVVRTLIGGVGYISDIHDQIVQDEFSDGAFASNSLAIPRAPSSFVPRMIDLDTEDANNALPIKKQASDDSQIPDALRGLRAPEILKEQLAAPKEVSMSSVLATLQTDQYELVTKPAGEDMILQGHPGTGKTIIAVHRAAFLLHPENPRGLRQMDSIEQSGSHGAVLILGPSRHWVSHIQGALRQLIDDDRLYKVIAMRDFLHELAGTKNWAEASTELEWTNVSQELAYLVDDAVKLTRETLGRSHTPIDAVYTSLRGMAYATTTVKLEPLWVDYLKSLPRTLDALRQTKDSKHLQLLAYLKLRTAPPGVHNNYSHVIIDEAQDIYPIEWEILGRIGNQGAWTIVGDLNQRRADHTYGSWDDISQLFGLENSDGEHPVFVLEVGYRSTEQIIKFADQLLSRSERRVHSIQTSGHAPIVRKVLKNENWGKALLDEVSAIWNRVGQGSVAIITVDASLVHKALSRDGWRRENAHSERWTLGWKTVSVLDPTSARGLEFDGVLVVEPADFPENLGRLGVLYTSLTRANRFLTVIHTKGLPRGMRPSV